ncbi:MAG TPA: SMC-Scp complex subunit ScpB [Candidatus Doudnabacteria bacterium]|nr:SMC-Scp complex subunit ScpB [Candidatus Doudnabacteria bacterium]
MNHLTSQIHSLLFVASKPLTLKQLVKFTNASEAEINTALAELTEYTKNSGVVLLNTGSEFQLATNPEHTDLITTFMNSDLREQLTEATAEVLAIIAYRQPISKAEIESIRGVNSQYSIRALLMRGLIEKISNPNDARSNNYQITTEFLQQLGVSSVGELPSFDELTAAIKLPETPAAADSQM